MIQSELTPNDLSFKTMAMTLDSQVYIVMQSNSVTKLVSRWSPENCH